MVANKMIINLNVLRALMEHRVVRDLNNTFIVTIHRDWKETPMFASNQRNQTISMVVDAITHDTLPQ